MAETSRGSTAIRLIQSDETEPQVRQTAGRFEVAVVPVVDRNLNQVTEDAGEEIRPARLCGMKSTCIAIVEIE
jgi:hypothetical protein